MTMERFLLNGYQDEELYSKLAVAPVFPLVRELEFKYGLKVFKHKSEWNRGAQAFYMSYPGGLPACEVWADNEGGRDNNKLRYCLRSPFRAKSRGLTQEDRQTYYSMSTSTLMKTLEKERVIPTQEAAAESRFQRGISGLVSQIHRAIGTQNKNAYEFEVDEIHALVANYLGVESTSSLVKVSLDKCKKALDRWVEDDRLKTARSNELDSVLLNPFFMICVDIDSEILVGKFKLQKDGTELDTKKPIIIEPFTRYKSYKDAPDVVSIMTMIKMAYENKVVTKFDSGIPIIDEYNVDLQAAFFYPIRPTVFEHQHIITPCPM